MELTGANGDKIRIVFNPLMWCRLVETKFLHNDEMHFIVNKTTLVMMKFHLN